MNPILKNGTRILRPSEATKLISGIYNMGTAKEQKLKYSLVFEALLYTGMRYVEMQRFQRHPEWFDKEAKYIFLPKMAQRKKKQIQKERNIRLNSRGVEKVALFLEFGKKVPTYDTWRENLQRWAIKGGLDPNGLTVRTTRKTIECWLIYYYPHETTKILLSMGHTGGTSLDYYLNMPFTENDKNDMEGYIDGWFD